jgi:hypothetical protein
MAKPKTPPKKKPDDDEDDKPDGEKPDGDDDDEDDDRKINAIVTSRVNRALKPLLKEITGLKEALTKATAKPDSDDEDDDDADDGETPPAAGKKPEGKPSKGESRKLSAMEKRLKAAEDRADAAEKAQKEAADKAKLQEENSTIYAALAKAGISDPKVQRAVASTLREDELIVRDEETGKIRFKSVDKYGTEDLVDPESGLGKWLKSDGKAFLPAVAAGGSGAGGSALRNAAGSQQTKADLSKLSKRERAVIDLERASSGLPPLGQD